MAGDGGAAGDAGSAGMGAAAGTAGSAGSAGVAGSAGSAGGCAGNECEGYKNSSTGAPPMPTGASPIQGSGALMAIKTLDFGGSDGWKTVGFNLDGYDSDAGFGGRCKPQPGGKSKDIRDDGDHGIDNAFAKGILPLLKDIPMGGGGDKLVNEPIAGGNFTMLVDFPQFATSSQDYSSAPATIRVAQGQPDPNNADLFVGPTASQWADGGYTWHPWAGRAAEFKKAYVSGGTWVSGQVGGTTGTLPFALGFSEFSLNLQLHHSLATLKPDGDGNGGVGVIGGILKLEDLLKEVSDRAPAISVDLCQNSSLLDNISQTIRQAADVMVDGSQDPNQTCDGVSFGVAFTAKRAELGAPVQPPPPEDLCKNLPHRSRFR